MENAFKQPLFVVGVSLFAVGFNTSMPRVCKLWSVFMVSAGRKNRRAEAGYLDMLPLSCLGRGIHTVRRPSAAFVGSLATAIWFSVGVRSPYQVTPGWRDS